MLVLVQKKCRLLTDEDVASSEFSSLFFLPGIQRALPGRAAFARRQARELSNWWVRNHPCVLASSITLTTIPMPRCA